MATITCHISDGTIVRAAVRFTGEMIRCADGQVRGVYEHTSWFGDDGSPLRGVIIGGEWYEVGA